MAGKRAAARLLVDGMSCASCEARIEKAVGALAGVRQVRASAALSEVMVYYDGDLVSRDAICAAVTAEGYTVRPDASEGPAPRARPTAVYRFLGLLAVVGAVYLILRATGGFTFLPTVTQSMGYGLIFLVGLLTSLHCVAMCGGIALSQGIKKSEGDAAGAARLAAVGLKERMRPNLLYNAGRVISYTVIGGIVGAVGSRFSLTTALKGVMPFVAGAFMLFLGVRMLGLFPALSRLKVRFPGLGGSRLRSALGARGPFVVGLLNGLMPCGPLQTMQVYALGTGSFLAGALSMFLFSIGTVPLLLGFGAVSSLLSAKFNRGMVKASGVLVMALGLVMFGRGMSLFGVALPAAAPRASNGVAVATLVGDHQEVRTTVEASAYHPFVVQKGVPVRWTVSVKAEDLNACNGTLTVPQYGIRKQLAPGDNLIEFTPDQGGTIGYTCWMGMIRSSISVVPDLARLAASDTTAAAPVAASNNGSTGGIASAFGSSGAGGCCGVAPAGFANGRIPTDAIEVAKPVDGGQVAEITVNENGYNPAVIVVKRGVKAKIRFVAQSLSACNSIVDFPDYQGELDLRQQGQRETPFLDVTSDFSFQCGMGMLHGYVRVVDDTRNVDFSAVRAVVAANER